MLIEIFESTRAIVDSVQPRAVHRQKRWSVKISAVRRLVGGIARRVRSRCRHSRARSDNRQFSYLAYHQTIAWCWRGWPCTNAATTIAAGADAARDRTFRAASARLRQPIGLIAAGSLVLDWGAATAGHRPRRVRQNGEQGNCSDNGPERFHSTRILQRFHVAGNCE